MDMAVYDGRQLRQDMGITHGDPLGHIDLLCLWDTSSIALLSSHPGSSIPQKETINRTQSKKKKGIQLCSDKSWLINYFDPTSDIHPILESGSSLPNADYCLAFSSASCKCTILTCKAGS